MGVTVNVNLADDFPTGEVIIAATAVLAALIAAVTAQIRLRAQLEHDREMRDRDELRTTLDETAGELHDLYAAISSLEDATHATAYHDEDEYEGAVAEAVDRAGRLLYGLGPANSRLQLRLPPEHEIVRSHWNVRWVALQAIFAVAHVARGRLGLPDSPDLFEVANASEEERRELAESLERASTGDVERLDAELSEVRQDFIMRCRSYLSVSGE